MLKKAAINLFDKYIIYRKTKVEIKKYKDTRRRNLYSNVELTKEQQKKIDDLYLQNFGKRVPHTYHRHYMAFTGNYDENYFPETLYIPRFERFMNQEMCYIDTFSDKNILPYLALAGHVKMPKVFLQCSSGLYKNGDNETVSFETAKQILLDVGTAFCKPTIDTSSGQGCRVLNMQNGVDVDTGETAEQIILSMGENFVVQERLICHKQISDIHQNSCNTFRIITYRWRDEFYSLPTIMRLGVHGNCLDNAHAGGIFVAIDDDGRLHKTAFTEFGERFDKHPDSNLVFENYVIDGFPLCCEAAFRLHKMMPRVGLINWDFTLNAENEPVLIEANMKNGSVWLSQMAHGKGAFGDKTGEILRWISKMEKLSPEERKKHLFGKK